MSGDVLRDFVERGRRAQDAIDALGAGGIRHDCAQVERDNSDLFQALAKAITRLTQTRGALRTDDLLDVLDRTSRPGEQKPA